MQTRIIPNYCLIFPMSSYMDMAAMSRSIGTIFNFVSNQRQNLVTSCLFYILPILVTSLSSYFLFASFTSYFQLKTQALCHVFHTRPIPKRFLSHQWKWWYLFNKKVSKLKIGNITKETDTGFWRNNYCGTSKNDFWTITVKRKIYRNLEKIKYNSWTY